MMPYHGAVLRHDQDMSISRYVFAPKCSAAVGEVWFTDEGEIKGFEIFPKWRGKGYAKEMLAAVLAVARARRFRAVWLTVKLDNLPAITLYSGVGFAEVAKDLNAHEMTMRKFL